MASLLTNSSTPATLIKKPAAPATNFNIKAPAAFTAPLNQQKATNTNPIKLPTGMVNTSTIPKTSITKDTTPPAQPKSPVINSAQKSAATNVKPAVNSKSFYKVGNDIFDATSKQRLGLSDYTKNYYGAKQVNAPTTPVNNQQAQIDQVKASWANQGTPYNAPETTNQEPTTMPIVADTTPAPANQYDVSSQDAQIAALNKQVSNINDSERQGLQETQDQVIPMEFITGQQQSIENRALNQRQTLQDQLANLQAERTATLDRKTAADTTATNQANWQNALTTGGYTKANDKVDTSKVTFKSGLAGDAIPKLKELAQKPVASWTTQDINNWKYATGQDVTAQIAQNKSAQTIINPYTGEKMLMNAPAAGLKEITAGTSLYDPTTGKIIGTAPTNTAMTDYQKAQLTQEAEKMALGQQITPYQQSQLNIENAKLAIEQAKNGITNGGVTTKALKSATDVVGLLDQVENDPLLGRATGLSSWLGLVPGTSTYDTAKKIEQLKSSLSLTNMGVMTGVLTDRDMQVLASAASALTPTMSEQGFKTELAKIRNTMNETIKRASGGSTTNTTTNPINNSTDMSNVSW